MPTKNLLQQRP